MDIYNEAYQAYVQCDKSKAAAAKMLNLPISTFKGRLDSAIKRFNASEPVICFWDIETSHIISAHYGMHDININHSNILLDWRIVCAAWKIRGQETQSVSLLDDMERFENNNFDIRNLVIDDYHVVKTLHDMLSGIDILVHHNGDSFDLKKFNTRALQLGFPPLNKIKTVDTLKEARKQYSISSNSLEYLCEYLELPAKIHNEYGLALKVSLCDIEAIKDYVEYNKQDVTCLEAVYYKLLPNMQNHPNVGLFNHQKCCPKCAGRDIIEDGLQYTKIRAIKSYRCQSCGAVFTDGKTVEKAIFR